MSTTTETQVYDITIPLFTKRIQQLRHYISKSEQWCKENSKDPSNLIQARIYEDMRPLAFQIQTCYRMVIYLYTTLDIHTSDLKYTRDNPPPIVETLPDLYEQLDEAEQLLGVAKREDFAGKRDEKVKFGPPGRAIEWDFTGLSFVQDFVLVNFFFHSTTAYNILRMQGVPLGKLDFLGKVGLN